MLEILGPCVMRECTKFEAFSYWLSGVNTVQTLGLSNPSSRSAPLWFSMNIYIYLLS